MLFLRVKLSIFTSRHQFNIQLINQVLPISHTIFYLIALIILDYLPATTLEVVVFHAHSQAAVHFQQSKKRFQGGKMRGTQKRETMSVSNESAGRTLGCSPFFIHVCGYWLYGLLAIWTMDIQTSGLLDIWTSGLLSRCPKNVLIGTFQIYRVATPILNS